MENEIYLDNSATTKLDERVLEAMKPYFSEHYGNPSSTHDKGQASREALEEARETIAEKIKAKTEEIIFTSGGTESNNLALKGLFFHAQISSNTKPHIITTKIEHDSILEICKWLETQGAEVTYLEVDREGFIDKKQLKESIKENTLAVSIIHGNNEIGTIQDLEEIGQTCKENNLIFHTDACQTFTKTELSVKKFNLDLVTLNAHKIHGPKGIGALYIKNSVKTKITPLQHGGGHENGLRSGTENTPLAVGFAKAVEISNKKEVEKIQNLRDKLIEELLKIENTKINGSKKNRLPNNINISFEGVEGEALETYLNQEKIYVSTGSACQSQTDKESHVLKAMGLNKNQIESSLRISLSKYTTEGEIEKTAEKIKEIVGKLRSTGL
ncbi:MAG: cysteine desulfurase family protein [Candidatus Pacearchaeota archaeon]